MSTREQLTLFVAPAESVLLESVRARLDPVQAERIAAHVTLCREDEIAMLDATLADRLASFDAPTLTLRFGPPEPFQGHGIVMRCVAGEVAFQRLRAQVLGSAPRRHQPPHLTLAHPRNPKAANREEAALATLANGCALSFDALERIRQHAASPWHRLQRFTWRGARRSS